MLGQLLPEVIFGYMLVMIRISALIIIVPVLGEAAISPRIRFGLAFMIALVVYPVVQGTLPAAAACVPCTREPCPIRTPLCFFVFTLF